MSATTLTAKLRALPHSPIRPIDVLWSAFALAMLGLMKLAPAEQTIPYHFLFVSFTLLYGYRLWSPAVTIGILSALTVIPGLMFLDVYSTGAISLDELAEVPLMPLIVGGMAWHAHRSAAARRRVEELAALESSWLDRQRQFLRDSAHAIRTPVTIARGYIELIQLDSDDPQLRTDADEVLHQLDRMHALARQLLVIEALQTTDQVRYDTVDVQQLVTDVARRWAQSAHRTWVIDAGSAVQLQVDGLRLEESLDAMIENALRHTDPDDTLRISCTADGAHAVLSVADSGPGIALEDRTRVFDRFFHRQVVGEEPGTGLGLALVAAVAEAFSGSVTAGVAPEGGALLTLRLPRI
jgi:signal transduction histidine kinase